MKPKLLLDIDGVLANFYHGFGEFLNKNYNAGLDMNVEPSSYVFREWGPNLANVDTNKASMDWIMSGGMLNIPIYDGARDFVLDLVDHCNIYIVTARVGDYRQIFPESVVDRVQKDTYAWFEQNGMPVEKIYFEHKKIDFCKTFDIPILIEDKLVTVQYGADHGIKCVLMDRAWNQQPNDASLIYRVKSYDEALAKVKELT